MKAQTQFRPFPVGAALIAGLIGGVVLDLKLIFWNHAGIPQMWQFIASTLVGPVAFTNSAYAILGFVMHFAVSIFWASAYILLWSKISSLRNWIVGGVVWGVIVMLGMVTLLHFKTGMAWPALDKTTFDSLVGHTVFFGLPIAWYVGRSMRAHS